jgi:septum formation protein
MAQITLVLASGSPRRRELLERIGLDLQVEPANVDESALADEEPAAHAARLAASKADAVAATMSERWVLAADTVVDVEGEILGKPGDAAEARAMLERLAGRRHRVTTGFALRGPQSVAVDRTVTTEVTMRPLDAAEIDDYVAGGEWRGKAGGYAVQGMAAAMVTDVRGSITNVIGLPLAEVVCALREAGACQPRYTEGAPA